MRARAITALLAATALMLLAAGPAQAIEPIGSFSTTSTVTQAGGHPDLHTSFTLENPGSPEAAENVSVNTPPGVFGNPQALTLCTSVDFAQESCPSSSQAGLITIYASYEGDPNALLGTVPIYDLVPGPEQTALFALIVPTLDIPIQIPVAVRTAGDYGLRFTVSEISQRTPLAGADLTFWGFPAAESHDAQRFPKGSPGRPAGCAGVADTSCLNAPTHVAITVQPLIQNPTTCTGSDLPTTLSVQTYQDPDHLSEAHSSYPAVDGCEKELFKPLLYTKPTTTETDSASGLDISINDQQFLGFAASPSEVRAATIVLPPGLTINPDAADGQSACTDAQANFGSEGPAACPDQAKIGTITITSPALAGPLRGSLYIGEPKPGDQYRLLMTVDGFGIHAKLVGRFRPDPATGQVTAFFEDLPQVPFDKFDIHLFSSDRGLMATPTTCTIYTSEGTFYPWNGSLPFVKSNPIFGLDSGPGRSSCPGQTRPFAPRLTAGTSNTVGGAFSSFSLQLDRDDGDQFLGDLNFTMPPGLTGSLRGISYCPEASIAAAAQNPGRAEQASPSCPATSQIGTTNVAAGPGSHPFHAIGRMYLAGPLKGAPLSLVAITPALAGPYDYGTVVVRVAVNIDPLDAHVKAVSDTVPSIIGGVPIRMRSIRVNIDRPNFMINPTNCSPFTIDSQGVGDQGTIADFSSYFHADNCASLPFQPKMRIKQLGGHKATKRSRNPTLLIDLWTRKGDANVKSLAVTLSNAYAIDQRHLANICSERELAATRCAGRNPIGVASTQTPLLDQPLKGPVYAVSGSGGLPRLAFILAGQVMLVPRADADTDARGRLRTTVPVIPDAPIGHFRLKVFGGKRGYLVNTRNVCRHTPITKVFYLGQNGRRRTQQIRMKVPCGGKAGKSARRSHHHR
jgi:hypothetical protein